MATEATLRKNVATFLDDYIGIAEGSTQHKKLLSIFNDSGLCTRYKMTVNDAWCATAVSAAFIANNLTSIFPCVECSCSRMIELADAAGIFVENDAYVPSVGDVILYDWDDSGKGDNTSAPDHVGIVYSVSGKTSFKVIEGNKSDTVGYRDMAVNGKYIRGFITPKYASVATSSSSSASTTSSSSSSTVTTTTSGNFKAKDKVTLKSVALYATSTSTKSAGTKSGTYYIWDATVTNGRIRITNSAANCGVSGQVTGWVNESDLTANNTGSASTTTSSSSSGYNKTEKWKGKVTTNGGTLNIRKGPGTEYDKLTSYPSLKNGTQVSVCDSTTAKDGSAWYYICYNGKYGFASAKYITKVS